MVTIVVPSAWATEGRSAFEVPAGSLNEVIKQFVAAYPGYTRRLLGPDQEPAGYVNVCVDDYLVPRHLRAATDVMDGSTVTLIPPMAGG